MADTGEASDVTVALLSLRPCPPLRGGGAAGFLGRGSGAVECEALGGVGGLGGGISSSGASGSTSTSGIFPAASRSKTLSLVSPPGSLGAGGNGLLRSELADEDLSFGESPGSSAES